MDGLISQNDMILANMLDFFGEPQNMEKFVKNITTKKTKKCESSLRIIDWFVTNYAKEYLTTYNVTTVDGRQLRFKVYTEYKQELDGYSKERFDPFCRWERTTIPYGLDKQIVTTIGQLRFFKWAIENGVLDYIQEHYDEIVRDMKARNSTAKHKKSVGGDGTKTRKKREELSSSATRGMYTEAVETTIRF